MATTTSTSAAAIIQKIVSGVVQDTLIQESVLIPSILDKSAEVTAGMDRLDIPRFTAMATQNVVEGTPNVPAAAVIAVDQLLMNINEAIFWAISDKADIQAKINMATQLVKDGARTLAWKIDDAIITQLLLASAAAPDHLVDYADAATNKIASVDIVTARALLNKSNVPMSDRYLLISPEQEANMLQITDFIDASKYGNADAVQNGEIGRVFGFKVLLSTSAQLGVAGVNSIFYHRTAVAYASQISSKFEMQRNLLGLEDNFALSHLFGAKVLDLGKRQVVMS